MAEWGKYLKNAVANVEQQLDKVLLEQQNASPSSRTESSTTGSRSASGAPGRVDLAERLRKAASGRSESKARDDATKVSYKEGPESRSGTEEAVSLNDGSMKASIITRPSDTTSLADVNGVGTSAIAQNSIQDGTNTDEGNDFQTETAEAEAEKNHETNLSEATPQLVVLQEFKSAPDLGQIVTESRQLALAVRRDDALGLVDHLETAEKSLNEYVDNMSERLKSAGSKIAVLSDQRSKSTTGLQQQIASLMDEGTRLSKRELDLNLTIKKLRSERSAALAKSDKVSSKDAEIAQLKAELGDSAAKLRDLEALTEHFRALAEGAPGQGSNNDRPAGQDDPKSSNDAHSEILQRHYSEERAKWHSIEANLLSRIAELEHTIEMRTDTTNHLHKSLKDAQTVIRSTRDQMKSLQDEVDAAHEAQTSAETRFKAQINELATELMIIQQQQQQQQQQQRDLQSQKHHDNEPHSDPIDEQGSLEPYAVGHKFDSEKGLGDNSQVEGDFNSISIERESLQQNEPGCPSADPLYLESENALSELNHEAVGPAGPFGVLADDFRGSYPPTDLSSPTDAKDTTDDAFSFINQSRRESSMQGSELVQGSQVHLVRKLTFSVKRLKNELTSAIKAAEISSQQRDEAQAEIVKLVNAQDQLQQLTTAYEKLEKENQEMQIQVQKLNTAIANKDERIEELDADVRDLKEMYKEQVEALITEIEVLKRR